MKDAFSKKALLVYFENEVLKHTCFDSFKELMEDRTDWQVNIVRCLIAVELKGVWRGMMVVNKLLNTETK